MDTNIGIKELKIAGKQKTKDLDYDDRRISCFIISLYLIQILNLAIKTIFLIPGRV